MNEVAKKRIEHFFAQATFQEVVKQYEQGQEFDGMKTVCSDDPKFIRSFAMGVIYSTCCAVLIECNSRVVDDKEIKELIIMVRDYCNK